MLLGVVDYIESVHNYAHDYATVAIYIYMYIYSTFSVAIVQCVTLGYHINTAVDC